MKAYGWKTVGFFLYHPIILFYEKEGYFERKESMDYDYDRCQNHH